MGALAARAFADQGCRTAAVLTSSPVFEGMENRMHGFRLEGEQHGLTILANRYCDNSIRGGYEAVSHRLRHEWKQQLPDAVFCGSSAIAHGALRAFCEAGYMGEKLPRLIAVGNGPEEMDAFSIPSLSVVWRIWRGSASSWCWGSWTVGLPRRKAGCCRSSMFPGRAAGR